MKTSREHELIARIGRRVLTPAALLVLVVSAAGVSRAQSPAPKPAGATRPAVGVAGNTSPATQATTPKPAAELGVSAGQAAPKGQSEGITVHGRWVIEVKNPDGTVVTHREFENAIVPGGEGYLAALLAGNNSPGGLSILLNGANSQFPGNPGSVPSSPEALTFSEAGPCAPSYGGGPPTGTTCLIANLNSYLGYYCYLSQVDQTADSLPNPCSTNLTTTAVTLSGSGAQSGSGLSLVLQGSAIASAPTGGNVNDVETVFTTCKANDAPESCVDFWTPPANSEGPTFEAYPVALGFFTSRLLDGNTTAGDPAPVPYSSGQTIAVTVTLTFQ
jgi:hypothetical protein